MTRTDGSVAEGLEDERLKTERPPKAVSPPNLDMDEVEKPYAAETDHTWWPPVDREEERVQDSPNVHPPPGPRM